MAARIALSKKTAARTRAAAEPVTATVAVAGAAVPTSVAVPTNVLKLGPSLSIREVGEYGSQLRSMLTVGPIEVDASLLETVDTAGLQMLLAAALASKRHGFKLKLRCAQGVKSGAARALGLDEHLDGLVEVLP